MSDGNGNGAPPSNEFGLQGSGHQQIDALKLFAYSRAIPGTPKPRLKLPGDDVQDGSFAKAFWSLVRERGVFRRDFHVCLVNEIMKRLDFMDGHMVKLWGDDVVDCYKTRFQKGSGDDGSGEFKQVLRSMPVDVARGLLARVKVDPGLLCEVEKTNYAPSPVLRENGEVELLQPGYDIESKTFTFDCGFKLDETMDVADAHDLFTERLSEFPFGDGVDDPRRSLAVQVACMMTLFARGLLPNGAARPMFIFNANTQRSGKSLLAKMALLSVFGTSARSSWSENKEEFRKTLDTVASVATPYIFFDNVRHHMAQSDLESFVTSPAVTFRVMGKNTETVTVPNVATVLITANQATTSSDIAERSLFVNLFVNEADAQLRRVAKPIDEAVLASTESRREILSALWAMVRHWVKQDKWRNHDSRLVGFEQWSEIIGGIVRSAGFLDPLTRPQIVGVGDQVGQKMKELVTKLATIPWEDAFAAEHQEFEKVEGGRSFTFGQVAKVCANNGLFDHYVPDDADMKPKDRSSFGKFLARYIGRGRVFSLVIEGKAQRLELKENGESGRNKRFLLLDVPAQRAV